MRTRAMPAFLMAIELPPLFEAASIRHVGGTMIGVYIQ